MRKDHLNHKPTVYGVEQVEKLRVAVIGIEDLIASMVPDCRERSIALTKLEECRMWAVKGIVFDNTESIDDLPEVET